MLFIGLVRMERNLSLLHLLHEFMLGIGHMFEVIGMNFFQALTQQSSNAMADDAIR